MSKRIKQEKQNITLPTQAEIQAELKRERYKRTYFSVLRSTIFILITVAASAVLVALLFMPVLQIYGNSMNPTLNEGNIVISVKGSDIETGDVVAFYWNNRILVKRAIAMPGDWVDLDDDGTVYVNGGKIDEPYLQEKAFGECNIELPYQVPESHIFVMGDNRSVSIDSRNSSVGCIALDEIVGKIVFRVYPINEIGIVETYSENN